MASVRMILKEAAWIILTAIVLTVGGYALRPDSLASVESIAEWESGEGQESGALAIDVTAAAEHLLQGTAIFADARSVAAYDAGHIEGAVHLNPYQFDQWSEQVFAEMDPATLIITYCDGERCSLGIELAEKLTWLGFENIRILTGGWSGWTAAQLPINKRSP